MRCIDEGRAILMGAHGSKRGALAGAARLGRKNATTATGGTLVQSLLSP
jgi:hypothetical protein